MISILFYYRKHLVFNTSFAVNTVFVTLIFSEAYILSVFDLKTYFETKGIGKYITLAFVYLFNLILF